MRSQKFLAAFLVLISAIACDRQGSSPGDNDQSEPVEVDAGTTADAEDSTIREVAATDEYGDGLNGVAAVAFWSHPSISFNSLIIAGHDEGLTAYNIESGEEVASIDGFDVVDLALAYRGTGTEAVGYLAVATADENDPMRFYEIDNANSAFILKPTVFVARSAGATGYCLGALPLQGGLTLVQTREEGVTIFPLTISDAGISSANGASLTWPAEDCAIDAVGDFYAVDSAGNIKKGLSDDHEIILGAAVPGASHMALVAKANDDGAKMTTAVILDESATAHLVDLDEAHVKGAVRMRDTFDVKALEKVSAMAVGYGNYGAVYRDGALAFVDKQIRWSAN